jgi:hypothetical protein
MRAVKWFAMVALAACSVDSGPSGTATFSDGKGVISARATTGSVFYGAPLAAWTITLSAIDGCASTDSQASIEIDELPNGTSPSGMIPLRVAMNPDTLPSGLFRYGTETVVSGTVTIDSLSSQFVMGELSTTTDAGTLTATFTAPFCD